MPKSTLASFGARRRFSTNRHGSTITPKGPPIIIFFRDRGRNLLFVRKVKNARRFGYPSPSARSSMRNGAMVTSSTLGGKKSATGISIPGWPVVGICPTFEWRGLLAKRGAIAKPPSNTSHLNAVYSPRKRGQSAKWSSESTRMWSLSRDPQSGRMAVKRS